MCILGLPPWVITNLAFLQAAAAATADAAVHPWLYVPNGVKYSFKCLEMDNCYLNEFVELNDLPVCLWPAMRAIGSVGNSIAVTARPCCKEFWISCNLKYNAQTYKRKQRKLLHVAMLLMHPKCAKSAQHRIWSLNSEHGRYCFVYVSIEIVVLH
jgi:hypothetical protein